MSTRAEWKKARAEAFRQRVKAARDDAEEMRRVWDRLLAKLQSIPDERVSVFAAMDLEMFLQVYGDVCMSMVEAEAAANPRLASALKGVWLTVETDGMLQRSLALGIGARLCDHTEFCAWCVSIISKTTAVDG